MIQLLTEIIIKLFLNLKIYHKQNKSKVNKIVDNENIVRFK